MLIGQHIEKEKKIRKKSYHNQDPNPADFFAIASNLVGTTMRSYKPAPRLGLHLITVGGCRLWMQILLKNEKRKGFQSSQRS